MREPHEEGLASHLDPEPCVATREGRREASAGAPAGSVSSRETWSFRDADGFGPPEGNTVSCAIASTARVPRGRRPGHAGKPHAREPGDLVVSHGEMEPWDAGGRPQAVRP